MPRYRQRSTCSCGEKAWIVVLRQGWCRKCFVELNQTFDTPTGSRLSKYGLSLEKFGQIFMTQEGRCRICRCGPPLVIDHDHGTGRVRGLLCSACNSGLGFFRDNPLLLREAIEYLAPGSTVTHKEAATRRVKSRDASSTPDAASGV